MENVRYQPSSWTWANKITIQLTRCQHQSKAFCNVCPKCLRLSISKVINILMARISVVIYTNRTSLVSLFDIQVKTHQFFFFFFWDFNFNCTSASVPVYYIIILFVCISPTIIPLRTNLNVANFCHFSGQQRSVCYVNIVIIEDIRFLSIVKMCYMKIARFFPHPNKYLILYLHDNCFFHIICQAVNFRHLL